MEPICMYFADLSVQYRRKVRKETGAQASYFVGVIKDSDEAHVKAYLSKSAKTPVSEFTVKFRLNDANSISQSFIPTIRDYSQNTPHLQRNHRRRVIIEE